MYHYRGNSDLYDDPYYEKHYYYSPRFATNTYTRSRYYNVSGLPDPYYYSYPSYWSVSHLTNKYSSALASAKMLFI